MKKTLAKIMAAVLVAATLVACFASCGKDKNYAKDNTEIYIGCSGPLTGDAASYGIAVENSAKMAVEEINAAGGINLNGTMVKIKFEMKDDADDPSKVSANYATMYEDGMQIGLGCVTTGPCKEFKSLSNEDNLFFLTPSASADTIVEFDNAFQMCFANNKQGVAAAKYVNENYAGKKIGVLYRADDSYSTGIYGEFKKTLDSSFSLVEASFSSNTVASFATQIGQLKDCDFIFMPIYYDPAAQFMTEGKNDVKANAVYYGCDGLDGIDTAVKGFDITTIPQEVSYLSHFNSKATDGLAKDYIDKYVAKYGSDAPLNQFGASAYDCVYAIKAALEKADNVSVNSSPSDICETLKAIFTSSDFKVTGATGTNITWDKNGFVQKDAVKYVVKAAD